MNNKFKSIVLCAAAAAFALPLAACGNDGEGGNGEAKIKVYMPDGAPAIALAALMDGGYENTEFTVVPAASIAAQVSSGEADMAIMPVNAAATLYNGGVDIVMLSVNTHGNLYIVGDGDNIGLDGLVGKRLGVIGRGNVPDITLRMLTDEADIDCEVSDSTVDGKIAVRYADDGGALMPLLKTGAVDYALLAEPAVTTAVNKLNKSIVADMQSIWRTTFDGQYPQACLVAKKSLITNNKSFVDGFMTALALSEGWAESNPDKALAAVTSHMQANTTTTLSTLNAQIVDRCNIKTVFALDAQEACNSYFVKLSQMKNELDKPLLAKVPDDGFYYRP